MKNTKLIELLSSFSKTEFRKFGMFLRSPYFNKNDHIIKFYNALKKLEKSTGMLYDKNFIYRDIYSEEIFNDQRMRSLESDFVQLGIEYLYQESNKCSTLQKDIFLLKQFRIRRMVKNFNDCIKKITKISDEVSEKDWVFYYLMMNKKYEEITLKSDNYEENLKDQYIEADYFSNMLFIYLKLSIENSMNNRDIFSSEQLERTWWFNAAEQYVQANIKNIEQNDKLVFLEYIITKLKKSSNAFWYNKFMDFIILNLNDFSDDNLKYIMGTFTGFHIKLISKNGFAENHITYYTDLKRMVNKGLYKNQKIVFHSEFLNIIITGIGFKDSLWVEKFRNKYINKVNKEYYEEVKSISEALILFSKKKYNEVLSELSMVKNNTSYFYGYIKILTIKSYYELNEFENLIYTLEAFKKFLYRKGERRPFNITNLNFVNTVFQLIKLKDKKNAKSLLQSVSNKPMINDLIWIKDKISEKFGKNKQI